MTKESMPGWGGDDTHRRLFQRRVLYLLGGLWLCIPLLMWGGIKFAEWQFVQSQLRQNTSGFPLMTLVTVELTAVELSPVGYAIAPLALIFFLCVPVLLFARAHSLGARPAGNNP